MRVCDLVVIAWGAILAIRELFLEISRIIAGLRSRMAGDVR
jgi:hypothetical protein